jgi:GTPase Era involved in 16S rRNA processing
MQTDIFLRITDDLRDATLKLATDFTLQAQLQKVRNMDQDLISSIQRLSDNKNTVLVVGEVKSGKSSFINAVMGKSILPVEDEVATGQAIMLSNRSQKEFRLVFTDNSTQKIKEAELITYASQKIINENGGLIRLGGKQLSHIEVDYPAHFLPTNLILVDTPGAGTLISYHIEITQRFIPEADAVIFVVDSYKPVLESDLNFIEEILHYTPHIFFIQTKIDIVDEWEAVRKRNEELLKQHLGGRVNQSFRVWPISNSRLLKASQTGNEKKAERYLNISRFKELNNELERFLYFVSGLSKTLEVLSRLKSYSHALVNILDGRRYTLSQKSSVEMKRKLIELNKKKQLIKANWGLEGRGTKEAILQMGSYLSSCKQKFWQLFEDSSNIYTTIATKIEQIDSIKEGQILLKKLPEEVGRIFMRESDQFFKEIHSKLNEDYQEISRWLSQEVSPYGNDQKEDFSNLLEDIFNLPTDVIKGSIEQSWALSIKVSIQKTISSLLLPTITVFRIVDHIFKSKKRLERTKKDLLNVTRNCLSEMHDKCRAADPDNEHALSPIDSYFLTLMNNWKVRLNYLLESRKAELDEEIKRLKYQVSAAKDQLEKELKRATDALKSWQNLQQTTDQHLLKCKEILQEMIGKEY